MTTRTARRLLIVGWDAADWQVIDPLLAKGQLPVLASLIERGVRSDLTTLEPKLSPLLWTSIATGRTPDLHGITNVVEPKPDGSGLRVASSTSRRVKALWNIAHQAGLRAQVHARIRSRDRFGVVFPGRRELVHVIAFPFEPIRRFRRRLRERASPCWRRRTCLPWWRAPAPRPGPPSRR
jgi:hypothetical protein